MRRLFDLVHLDGHLIRRSAAAAQPGNTALDPLLSRRIERWLFHRLFSARFWQSTQQPFAITPAGSIFNF